jgi:hypothetical protein
MFYSIEPWNRRINTLAETSHLPLYRMIITIKEEQQNTEVFLARREGGEPAKAKKLKQVNLNKRLYNMVSTYNDRELDVFLRGIAVNKCNLRSTSASFAPHYSTTNASANNRKRKGTHSQQNLTNKRSKIQ